MSDNEVPTQKSRRGRRLGWGAGLLAAGALSGAVLAGTLPASAATPSAAPSTSESSQPPGQAPAQGQRPSGTPGQRAGETVLTGTFAAQAKAAALKAVPGATIDRVETDADGATYEAHLTKSDGSKVTVKFDKSLVVLAIQDGMGTTKQPTTAGGA